MNIKLIENIIKNVLTEGLSQVLYHFTTISHLYNIVKNDNLKLSSSLGSDGADDYGNRDKVFYLSCTRQKNGSIGYSRNKNVRIELDGDLLSKRFSGKAMDYWGSSMGKMSYYTNRLSSNQNQVPYTQDSTESEDRLFSKEPFINGISSYIKHVDVLLENTNDKEVYNYNFGICYFVYTILYDKVTFFSDKKSFELGQRKNNINEFVIKNGYKYYSAFNNKFDDIFQTKKRLSVYIANIINYILYGEVSYENYIQEGNKLISKYQLDSYRKGINIKLKQLQKDCQYFSEYTVSSMTDNLGNSLNHIMEEGNDNIYENVLKMFTDYCLPRKITNLIKAQTYKNLLIKNLGNKSKFDVSKLDWRAEIEFMKIGHFIIVDPKKTNIWDVLQSYTKEEFIEIIYKYFTHYRYDMYHLQHKSKSDEHFYKYLQHLTKSFFSVEDYLNFLKKNGIESNDIDNLLNYQEISSVKVGSYDFDHPFHGKYVYESDVNKVYQMLINKSKEIQEN